MSSNLSIGALIWISVRPLISRLWLSGAFGFAITKADIFPLAASRGTGQIVLNVTLPCLMFSKIVPAFTPQNIDKLGVLVAVAFLYEAIGLFLAWSTKWFFWVPHRFRYGILCAGTISNYSDIPTAVITSITANIPFNPATDQTISVAYVAGFILVFFISLFPMGAHRLVAMDYVGPDVDDEDLRVSMAVKTKQSVDNTVRLLRAIPIPRKRKAQNSQDKDIEKLAAQGNENREVTAEHMPPDLAEKAGRHVTFSGDESTAAPTEAEASREPSPSASRPSSPKPTIRQPPPLSKRVLAIARSAGRSLLLPCSVTIVVSIVIAVVTPLKALFTPISNSPIPNAPDGQPPLAFILDCAEFVGAASVPLGLICLGSAVARVQLPRRGEWGLLPIGAIVWFAVTKMLLLPVLGVLIIQGLVQTGFIDKDDKVLRFVCMFISCVPTATSQVYLTQVYSGTGEAGVLPLFLVPQYVLMFISMTILIAYSLSILF
ncbi:uncharacterized protein FOMMEDRAFT_107402 [Fomitiporia mediterranea MF3/22]|uniref:uncharacterized protein n=1 Tax=Fomitiporia mediterranea (strain MF3/22) TaxID=694068 RepID=UPI0004409571|nr:uncharacterized protein FOMMEDRAFT_107402 [Fomitiporia mediterranea MF3/22]EJD04592.1 hypothetical protein FOMMEDRAFT_107402 [Fomitiporia mediterranea MF3/22]